MINRILVAGGGTGGHLFPGIAVVEELRRRNPDLQVTFMGTAKGIEARVIPQLGDTLDIIDAVPLSGLPWWKKIANVAALPRAVLQAREILLRRKPELVLGVGGYASGPALLAARTLGIPTAILEQNASPGMTNRMVSSWVGRAYVTFDATATQFGVRARTLGNPVRRSFVDHARIRLSEGSVSRHRTILVMGGSQGSQALNELVPSILAAVLTRYNKTATRPLRVLHQTGNGQTGAADIYRDFGVAADVVPFVENMAAAYNDAYLVIARAGATTLAEVTVMGCPAILVPFPQAAEDHQTKNAEALVEKGAALMVAQPHVAEHLEGALEQLLLNTETRDAMARASLALGRPDAAAEIVDDLLDWLSPAAVHAPGGFGTRAGGQQSEPPAKLESAPMAWTETVYANAHRPRSVSPCAASYGTIDFTAGRDGLELRRSEPPPCPVARVETLVARRSVSTSN